MDPYQELANGIILQAAKDYKKVLVKLKATKLPHKNAGAARKYAELLKERKEIRKFFHSGWYDTLTDANPDMILKRIEKEVDFYD